MGDNLQIFLLQKSNFLLWHTTLSFSSSGSRPVQPNQEEVYLPAQRILYFAG